MDISKKDVERVARLARLKLSDSEIERYGVQLGRILEHMRELNALDTAQVPAMTQVEQNARALREEEIRIFEDQQALLSNAPASEGPYFKVPKVIE